MNEQNIAKIYMKFENPVCSHEKQVTELYLLEILHC